MSNENQPNYMGGKAWSNSPGYMGGLQASNNPPAWSNSPGYMGGLQTFGNQQAWRKSPGYMGGLQARGNPPNYMGGETPVQYPDFAADRNPPNYMGGRAWSNSPGFLGGPITEAPATSSGIVWRNSPNYMGGMAPQQSSDTLGGIVPQQSSDTLGGVGSDPYGLSGSGYLGDTGSGFYGLSGSGYGAPQNFDIGSAPAYTGMDVGGLGSNSTMPYLSMDTSTNGSDSGPQFLSTAGKQGYGGLALGALSSMASLYMGMKQYGLAKDTLKQNKKEYAQNYDAQAGLTNTQMADRQAARVASNPGAYQSVGSYMATNSVKPNKVTA